MYGKVPINYHHYIYPCRLKFSYSSEEESDDKDVPELPLYSTVVSGHQASELANILMAKNIDLQRICHIQPLGVTKTATFIVDLDDVLFSDLKADDLGTWKANGTKSTYFLCLLVVWYELLLENRVVD